MANAQKLIEAFRDELFRWNSQINLVSRQETEDRLEGLFSQCIGGLEAIVDDPELFKASSEKGSRVYYFDLGSGGGLPGVIWHVLFSDYGPRANIDSVQSWLVEPREKRAWFLNRLNRIPSIQPFGVLRGRWGDVKVPSSDFSEDLGCIPVVVISLKALHLVDSEVLDGLMSVFSSFPESFNLIMARYYPPGQKFDQDLISLLDIPSSGSKNIEKGFCFTALDGRVLPLGSAGSGLASLVLSSYRIVKNA